MTKLTTTLLLATSLATVSACGGLTKRYRRHSWKEDDTTRVQVTAFADSPSPTTATRREVTDLSVAAQAKLVEKIAEKPKEADTLLASLGKRLGTSAAPLIEDRTRFKRKIVISIDKLTGSNAAEPLIDVGDRLREVSISVRLCQHCANGAAETGGKPTFLSWDKLETAYETVELATVSREKTFGYDAGISIGPRTGASTQASANAGVEGSSKRTETVTLSTRYVALSGRLAGDTAHLFQESISGVDLWGNVVMDVEIVVPSAETDVPVFTFVDGNTKSLTVRPIRVARSTKPVQIVTNGNYVVRRIENGADSIEESDDCVTFLRGTCSGASATIVAREALTAKAWQVYVGQTSVSFERGNISVPARFAHEGTARQFVQWWKSSKAKTIGSWEIQAGESPNHELVDTREVSINEQHPYELSTQGFMFGK